MKNKISALLCFTLCVCFLLTSCASGISVLEEYCFAVADFELEKAAELAVNDAEKYFETVLKYYNGLTKEQRDIAKELYSRMKFTDFAEDGDAYTVTVKYIDFSALIDSGRIEKQFLKTEQNVRVMLSDNDGKTKLSLGYSGENSRFTALVGLDTFLRWYSGQR